MRANEASEWNSCRVARTCSHSVLVAQEQYDCYLYSQWLATEIHR